MAVIADRGGASIARAPPRALRADGAQPRLRDRGRAPVQGRPHRRLLPPLLRPGGHHRRRGARARARRPARHRLPLSRLRARARRPARGRHGRAVRPRRRLRARPRRLDAPARRGARLLRRLGHRRRASCRWPPASRSALVRQRTPAGGALRARRRRGEHGRLARVAQPGRALAPADRLPGRQQRVRHGHVRRAARPPSRSCGAARRRTACTASASTATISTSVVEAADRLLREAREERRPAVLEAITYRYRGHSVADAGLAYRSKDEIAGAPGARPDLARARAARRGRRPPRTSSMEIDDDADERVQAAVEFALASPEPAVDGLAARRARRGQRRRSSSACARAARSARRG